MKKRIPIDIDENLLGTIMDKQIELHTNIIHRSSFFVAIFTFILGISILKIMDNSFFILNNFFKSSLIVLAFTSFVCLIIIIMAMMPRVHSKKYTGDNLFYYGGFTKKYTKEEYSKKLQETISDPKKLINSYVAEIYELSNYVFFPAYNKIRYASIIFLMGLITSFILFILGFFQVY